MNRNAVVREEQRKASSYLSWLARDMFEAVIMDQYMGANFLVAGNARRNRAKFLFLQNRTDLFSSMDKPLLRVDRNGWRWQKVDNELVAYKGEGEEIKRLTWLELIHDFAFGRDNSLFILTRTKLAIYAPDGCLREERMHSIPHQLTRFYLALDEHEDYHILMGSEYASLLVSRIHPDRLIRQRLGLPNPTDEDTRYDNLAGHPPTIPSVLTPVDLQRWSRKMDQLTQKHLQRKADDTGEKCHLQEWKYHQKMHEYQYLQTHHPAFDESDWEVWNDRYQDYQDNGRDPNDDEIFFHPEDVEEADEFFPERAEETEKEMAKLSLEELISRRLHPGRQRELDHLMDPTLDFQISPTGELIVTTSQFTYHYG